MLDARLLVDWAVRMEHATRTTMSDDRNILQALGATTSFVNVDVDGITVRWPDGTRQDFHGTVGPKPPSRCLSACLDLHDRLLPHHHWVLNHPGYDEGIYQDGKSAAIIYHPLSSGGPPYAKTFAWTPARAWLAAILRMTAHNIDMGRNP
jgi:hypothetical protein